MAKSHTPAKKVRFSLSPALGQVLLFVSLLGLPGLVMVIVLAARNSLDTIASSPYAALAVAVMLLALALDVLTVLIMFAGRLPFKGSIQNKVVLFVVGLGLVLLTAKLIYLG